jgi:hypothetical protein
MPTFSIRRFKNPYLVLTLALWFFGLVVFPSLAAATLVPSKTASVAPSTNREADLKAVQSALEHKLVAQKLKDYGLSSSEVQAKLPQMSDADVHQIAVLSNKLPQGGDDGLGTIVVILVIVILVLVIIKIMNKQVVIR